LPPPSTQYFPSNPVESFSASHEPSDLSPTSQKKKKISQQFRNLLLPGKKEPTAFIRLTHLIGIRTARVGNGCHIAIVRVHAGQDFAAGGDHAIEHDLARAVVAFAVAAGAVDLASHHLRQL
jgi:hypothetical protein